MDFRQPIQAIIPGAQGRILAVLAEVSGELNLRTIARLSGVSPAQASRVLPTLVSLGLVERRDVPPSALFRLVEDHVAAQAVLSLARARQSILDQLGEAAARWIPDAVSVVVFGSVARGEAGPESDLDVLIVRPNSLNDSDEGWALGMERWRAYAGRLTGNPADVVEVAEAEIMGLLQSGRPLWSGIQQDGVSVAGRRLSALGVA